MIKRIELVNFMSHERTVVEPAEGLTVLVGPNNCGKSAFVSALQILCHNAKSGYVIRHGEKKCQIIVETDEGHTIEWSRTKSGSPSYLIDGVKHDRLRGGVPPQLHQILKLDKVVCDRDEFDVHFGEQKSPVFLVNDSGKAAAQFFASSSDAIRLVEMQDVHKAKVRDAKREQKQLELEKVELKEALECFDSFDTVEKKLAATEHDFKALRQQNEAITQAEIIIKAIGSLTQTSQRREAECQLLEKLAGPPQLADERRLEMVLDGLRTGSKSLAKTSLAAEQLGNLVAPPEMDNEAKLSRLVGAIRSQLSSLKRESDTLSIFNRLNAAPELAETTNLRVLVSELRKSKSDWDRLEAASNQLNQLADPPQCEDLGAMRTILASLATAEAALAKLDREHAKIEIEFERLKTEIAAWVGENPACPTCGNATSAKLMLSNLAQKGAR